MIGLKIAFTGLMFFILSTYLIIKLPEVRDLPLWVKTCLIAAFVGGAAAVISGLLFFIWQL